MFHSLPLFTFLGLASAFPVAPLYPRQNLTGGNAVTNTQAFDTGAGNQNNANTNDGIGAGSDSYTCYYGGWQDFPDSSKWVSFEDMWNANSADMAGCDSSDEIQDIYNAIQSVSQQSLVDHRFILATIMQESSGCVNVQTTNNGENNPGIMQSDNGSSFDPSSPAGSITLMVIDGTQGTGPGSSSLVGGINQFGNVYEAARAYNSGSNPDPDNLNDPVGATASYVNDIANRLTGWVNAQPPSC